MVRINSSQAVSRFYSYYFYSGNGSTYNQYGNGSPSLAIDANGYIASWGFLSYSDKRIKENVKDLNDDVFEKINRLNPVSFSYIDKSKNSDKIQKKWKFKNSSKEMLKNVGNIPYVSTMYDYDTLVNKKYNYIQSDI